jgi:hypothetical protein
VILSLFERLKALTCVKVSAPFAEAVPEYVPEDGLVTGEYGLELIS